jgi:trans-aconitate 2-methyltransferase
LNETDVKNDAWDPQLYDGRHAFVWKFGASLVELLVPKAGETILDLGCGTGHLTAETAATGASVIGSDRSPQMIEKATQTYPHLLFEVADARALTDSERFDAVFSNAVLHWIKEPESVLRGIARALKPGGRFVAEFGGRGNIRKIQAAMIKSLQELGCESVESPWYYPGIAEYARLLEDAGLETTFATLFDRPTPLQGPEGMRDWIKMFCGAYLSRVSDEQQERFFSRIETELRPTLFREGTWIADYRRLRVVAWKK